MKQATSKVVKSRVTKNAQQEIERKWLDKFATKEEFQALKQEVKQSSEMMFKHFNMLEKNISTSISGEVKHMSYRVLTWMMPFMLSSLLSTCAIFYHILHR